MSQLRMAAIQMTSTEDKYKNLAIISNLVSKAAKAGANFVALPEYANYFAPKDRLKNAETIEGQTVSTYRELAVKHNIHIHSGSFLEISDAPGKSFNTTVLINPSGNLLAKYQKIHLYDVEVNGQNLMESSTIKAGETAVVCNTSVGCIGLTICYDLRFPDLYRVLANNGAEILFVPAAFNLYTGKDHWEPLLRARAIETQSYIIAAAQFGKPFANRQCFGNSMIIDPWGTIISRIGEDVGFTMANIDTKKVKSIRKNVPSLANQRLFSVKKT